MGGGGPNHTCVPGGVENVSGKVAGNDGCLSVSRLVI